MGTSSKCSQVLVVIQDLLCKVTCLGISASVFSCECPIVYQIVSKRGSHLCVWPILWIMKSAGPTSVIKTEFSHYSEFATWLFTGSWWEFLQVLFSITRSRLWDLIATWPLRTDSIAAGLTEKTNSEVLSIRPWLVKTEWQKTAPRFWPGAQSWFSFSKSSSPEFSPLQWEKCNWLFPDLSLICWCECRYRRARGCGCSICELGEHRDKRGDQREWERSAHRVFFVWRSHPAVLIRDPLLAVLRRFYLGIEPRWVECK